MSLREAGRRVRRRVSSLGGQATAAKKQAAKEAPPLPYGGSFLEFLDAVGRGGSSRATWRVFWKLADGLPLDPDEVPVFQLHTGRSVPPTSPARECWIAAGRRAGKSEQIVTRATWRAISKDWSSSLSAGERGIIPLVAADKDQARNTLGYLKGLAKHPLVRPYVERNLRDAVEFSTGAVVRVLTASWRSTRGYTMLDAILEECSFYPDDDSANADEEILAAIRPALLTVPGARVYGISSPYARRGILFKAWEKGWGKDESDTLVFVADTLSLNPTVPAEKIAAEFEEDSAVAASEYGRDGLVAFRSDVESFISREAVEAVTIPGRLELPRVAGVTYVGFCDPAGGSGGDSFPLAIAHRDREGRAVLDCLRELRPRFSPDAATKELSDTLKSYGLSTVTGDRYAGSWPEDRFRAHGVKYVASERSKSELYVECLPIINAARCELLDLPRLKAQLIALERRTARGTGRDSVDHPPGQHDDCANAVAGALVLAAGRPRRSRVMWGGAPKGLFADDGRTSGWEPPVEYDENGN